MKDARYHPTVRERYRGSLLGLACGDALGAALEFCPPGTFEPLTDMVGGGRFQLEPGMWTDDTSMMLCLSESLVECSEFNPTDQMERYLRWFRDGHHSSKERSFGIGQTTARALFKFMRTGEPHCGFTAPHTAGNGSIMRLAPVPLFYARQPRLALAQSGESSRTTHAVPACIDACRYLAGLIVGAVQGMDKEQLLSPEYSPIPNYWAEKPLTDEIAEVARGSFKEKQPPEISGAGHVVKTLEAALWAFYRSDGYEEGALLAVNLGQDADTVGAVYGQLAGAYYGEHAIPASWRAVLYQSELIANFTDRLYELSRDVLPEGDG